jgi:aminoglycoside phosphotransferase (APT) family kinase protein
MAEQAPMSERDAVTAITRWLDANIGGTVHPIEQQPRWRPMWFVQVERRGETLSLCVRGERSDTSMTWPLEHEMRFQQVASAQGVKVPKVYGWIEEPAAFVMEQVPGRPDFTRSSDAERDAVVDDYLAELARLHRLDCAPFVTAGVDRADEPGASGRVGMARMERMYRQQKVRVDPFLEWCLSWLHRHEPQSNGREAPVVWDSGQFHHNAGRLVALIDLELGHVGDPMMDLAGWLMRDSVIPFGNFERLYERYAALGGVAVDLDAIQLQHIAFTLANELAFSHALRDPTPATDYTTYLQWCAETNLYATEAIAGYLRADLPTVALPEPRPSRFAKPHQHLVRLLRSTSADDAYIRYQIRNGFRLSQHLMRADEIGDAVVAADLEDAALVLGEKPADWEEGERELERFVLADAAQGRHDDDLLWLFHRRNLRAQQLNGPAGSAMTRHNPIQGFGTAAGRTSR